METLKYCVVGTVGSTLQSRRGQREFYENLLNFPLVQVGYASKIFLIADSRLLKITSKEEKMLYGFLGLTKAFSGRALDFLGRQNRENKILCRR
jgi:hypothetical protein